MKTLEQRIEQLRNVILNNSELEKYLEHVEEITTEIQFKNYVGNILIECKNEFGESEEDYKPYYTDLYKTLNDYDEKNQYPNGFFDFSDENR